MVRMFKPLALVGAVLIASSAPAFAQATGPLGIDLDPLHIFTPVPAGSTGPLGIDLDPLHIFTPVPSPAPTPVMKKHKMHGHKMKKKM